MLPKDEIIKIEKGMTTLRIIWAAMLVSVFIYLFVGLFIKDKISPSMERGYMQIFRNILYVISFITLLASGFIRRAVLSGKGVLSATQGIKQTKARPQHPALARYSTAMIISLAMSESIAVYGLVLFFLGKSETDLYLLILVSAMAVIYYRPKTEEVVALARKMAGRGQTDFRAEP